MRAQAHTDATKTAIGYVRVSTEEKTTEGVSLDAQRDKLRGYCRLNGINRIDIKADEGYSGSTLNRPALHAVLQMLRWGRANTLLVAKLDRLSRSLRDVCTLVDELFSDGRYHLLSLCGRVNTHSAAGRMARMHRANDSQFEREMISERTCDALQHMKAQGIRIGPAPYGYRFSHDTDENGRRWLVPLAEEQDVLRQTRELRSDGMKLHQIARLLNDATIQARHKGIWRLQSLTRLAPPQPAAQAAAPPLALRT